MVPHGWRGYDSGTAGRCGTHQTRRSVATGIPEETSMQQVTIGIAGMSCGGCVSTVREALEAVPDTTVDAVTVGSATISYDPSDTTAAAIDQALRDAGYEPITDGAPVTAAASGGCGCGCG